MTKSRHTITLAFLALTVLAASGQAQLATYTVASQPILEIGSTDPTSSQKFQQIRSVRILPGRRLLVADGLTNEIRLFEGTGAHLKTISEPGQFARLAWVGHLTGDSLLAVDFQRMRGSIIDSRGNLGRVFRIAIAAEHYMAIPRGTFANGTIVSLAGPPREVTDSAGGNWVFVALVLSRSDETLAGRITPIPQRWCPTDGCARRASPYQALWAVGGDRLYYFRPDRREIVAYDHTGRAVSTVPLSSLVDHLCARNLRNNGRAV
jgi:hypothetical protein